MNELNPHVTQYCCKEHQREDWAAHKGECKVFQRIGARATFYVDAEMLERFPMRPAGDPAVRSRFVPRDAAGTAPLVSCALCLKTSREAATMCTGCCGEVICDTEDDYQLMSYSREYCSRSHDRYTLCGYHGVEKECDKAKDWRECPECQSDARSGEGASDRLWRGLNPYNFYPLLSSTVPRHALCATCNQCSKKFLPGAEGSCHKPVHGLTCLGCSGRPF